MKTKTTYGLLSGLVVFALAGLLVAQSRAATAGPLSLPCYPGTGAAEPPTSPYPARAFLPLVAASNLALCAEEIEPNDTHTVAQAVTSGCVAARVASIADDEWSADTDWFALRLCSAVTLTVRTKGPLTSAYDLDLYLHGEPPGVPLASSEGPGLGEIVSARLVTGTYYTLVQPAHGLGGYELWFEVQR